MYGDISLHAAEINDLEVADRCRIAQLKSALMMREAAFTKRVGEWQQYFDVTECDQAINLITQQSANLKRHQLASREAQLHLLAMVHERERNHLVLGQKLNKHNVKRGKGSKG